MKSQKIMELETLMPTEMDAGQVFTGTPTGKAVKGYKETCSYTPSVDPRYIFHESARDVVVWFMHDLDPLYLYGPTGCGKTTLIKQLAARLNYPTFEVTGHGRLEFADLCGHISLQKGSMVYEYGPLPLAMRYGGILLINEADLLSPEVAVGLNGVLDGAPLCLPENGGEVISPHEMFRIACTAVTTRGSIREPFAKTLRCSTGTWPAKSVIPRLKRKRNSSPGSSRTFPNMSPRTWSVSPMKFGNSSWAMPIPMKTPSK